MTLNDLVHQNRGFYGFYICLQWTFIHALLSRVPFALAGLSCFHCVRQVAALYSALPYLAMVKNLHAYAGPRRWFLRATAVPAGTAVAHISYGDSVCPSLSVRHEPVQKQPSEIETPGLHHMIA